MNPDLKVTGRILPVSEDTKRRNPQLFQEYLTKVTERVMNGEPNPITGPRIRQSKKPLLNKLETEFFEYLNGTTTARIYPQAVTFRLANGVRYTPDLFSFGCHWYGEIKPVAWEVKGPWFTDDAKVKIKLFAAAYLDIVVLLCSKEDGRWYMQRVYP